MAVTFPEPKFYQAGDLRMEVFEQGEGYPVILAHGFPELAFSWRFQIPALAEAGYRVIAPNQRGYGKTDKPGPVEAYDLRNLCGDMAALMDALEIDKAVFIGHDWGGPVVWHMPRYYPERVAGVIGMSVPFSPRGDFDPVARLEQVYGPDHYVVHFNRQPGVADAAFAANTRLFFNNIFRKGKLDEKILGGPGYDVSLMATLNITDPTGEPLMTDEELDVFVRAFSEGGFTGPMRLVDQFTSLSAGPGAQIVRRDAARQVAQMQEQIDQQVAAQDRAAGATPIRVRLPLNGRLFRLEKILALPNDRLWFELQYSGWEAAE